MRLPIKYCLDNKLLAFIAFIFAMPAGHAQTAIPSDKTTLTNSFRPINSTPNGLGAFISRSTLTSAELSAPINLTVSLPFRNFGELKAKVSNHEKLSFADLDYAFLPLPSSYRQVATWLSNQGLIVGAEDPNHTLISVSGTVSRVATVFQTTFAHVKSPKGEFTSAITPPVIPSSLSDAILGISGLQPYLMAEPSMVLSNNKSTSTNIGSHPPTYTTPTLDILTPGDIRSLYNAPSGLTGSSQTVAIIMDAPVSSSDLSSYNSYTGNSMSGSFTEINVGTPVPSSNNSNGDIPEANLDVETVAGMAPAANIRLYTIPTLSISNIEAGLNQILYDIRNNIAAVSVISMSFGGGETSIFTSADLNTMDQIFVATTALGVTNVASSGDYGCYPNSSASSAMVQYPASDPYVTSVGGTAIHIYDTQIFSYNTNTTLSSGSYIAETLYSQYPSGSTTNTVATGGGVSTYFSLPSWQNGNGTLLGGNGTTTYPQTGRCVPDVSGPFGYLGNYTSTSDTASNGSWNAFMYAMFTNVDSATGTGTFIAYRTLGTSFAAPVWAGIVALINQNRGSNGTIGYLNPWLYQIGENYSINGTVWSAFRDVDSSHPNVLYNGSYTTYSNQNGAYSTGPGYDLCTGLGTPNITNLAGLLQSGIYVSAPQSQTVAVGATCVFSAFAEISPFEIAPATYQWYCNGTAVSGQTNPQILLSGSNTQLSNNGDTYYCVVTLSNTSVTITSSTATLSVSSTSDIGHLLDLSSRAFVGTGSELLEGGFVIAPGSSGTEPILARVTGPTLGTYGVSGYLPDPTLSVYQGGSVIASDYIWGGTTALINAFSAVGAFSWPTTSSHDSAILFAPGQSNSALAPNPYTVEITGNSGDTGVALFEVYDANAAIPATWTPGMPYLTNISSRALVGTGANILIGGFVIGGSTSRTLLIRAVGPTLGAYGVSPALPDPQLTLYNPSTGAAFAANEGWNNNPLISSESTAAGAFSLITGSNDSALVVTLPPGPYTAEIEGAAGDTGIALIEIYLMP